MGKITEYQAQNLLKRLYANTSSSDTVTRDELFKAINRNSSDQKARNTLSTYLSRIKAHKYIYSKYDSSDHNVLMYIRLTDKGRKALQEARTRVNDGNVLPVFDNRQIGDSATRDVTPETVYADVKALREQMPSFDIKLVIEPKEEAIGRS